MKIILTLALYMCYLNAWTFTEKDLNNFTIEQQKALHMSYLIGSKHDFGLDLAAVCVVENMCKGKDNNPNHIAGYHQIDYKLHNLNKHKLETDYLYSAISAMKVYEKYRYIYGYNPKTNKKHIIRERSKDEMHQIYNAGFKKHKFNSKHLERINIAKNILRKHYD